MFELTDEEFKNLRSQIATSRWGGQRYRPYVFTEHGVLQLANVLRSKRARQMSIRIIEVFIKMREMLHVHKDVLIKVGQALSINVILQLRKVKVLNVLSRKSD